MFQTVYANTPVLEAEGADAAVGLVFDALRQTSRAIRIGHVDGRRYWLPASLADS